MSFACIGNGLYVRTRAPKRAPFSSAPLPRLAPASEWKGERIDASPDLAGHGFTATLENYDPTPWDSETPARGPHSRLGRGVTAATATEDLLEQLEEYE